MGTSHSRPMEWMKNDGTGKTTLKTDERGWGRVMPDGQEIVINCQSGAEYIPGAPKINGILVPTAGDYSIGAADELIFTADLSGVNVIA